MIKKKKEFKWSNYIPCTEDILQVANSCTIYVKFGLRAEEDHFFFFNLFQWRKEMRWRKRKCFQKRYGMMGFLWLEVRDWLERRLSPQRKQKPEICHRVLSCDPRYLCDMLHEIQKKPAPHLKWRMHPIFIPR